MAKQPKTDVECQFLVTNILDPETNIMDQFLDQETDIMGEQTFLGKTLVKHS